MGGGLSWKILWRSANLAWLAQKKDVVRSNGAIHMLTEENQAGTVVEHLQMYWRWGRKPGLLVRALSALKRHMVQSEPANTVCSSVHTGNWAILQQWQSDINHAHFRRSNELIWHAIAAAAGFFMSPALDAAGGGLTFTVLTLGSSWFFLGQHSSAFSFPTHSVANHGNTGPADCRCTLAVG